MALPPVETNVPIPDYLQNGPLSYKARVYGYHRLEVGHSLWFPGKTESAIRQSISNYKAEAQLPHWRLVYEEREEKGQTGIRVWRLTDEQAEEGDGNAASTSSKEQKRIGPSWEQALNAEDQEEVD